MYRKNNNNQLTTDSLQHKKNINRSDETSENIVRKRSWYLTTWLIVLVIINLLLTGVYIFIKAIMKPGFYGGLFISSRAPEWFFWAVIICYAILVYFTISILKWKKSGIYGYVAVGILRYLISFSKGGFSNIYYGGTGIGIFEFDKQSGIVIGHGNISSLDNMWNLLAIIVLIAFLFPAWKYFKENSHLGKIPMGSIKNGVLKIRRIKIILMKGFLVFIIVLSSFTIISSLTKLFKKSILLSIIFHIGTIEIIFYAAGIFFMFMILKHKKCGLYGYIASSFGIIVVQPIIWNFPLTFFNFATALQLLVVIVLLIMILPFWIDFSK